MLTKRQRIAGWIGLDAERRRRQAIVDQVTARLAQRQTPVDFDAGNISWPPPGGTFSQRYGFSKAVFNGSSNDFGVISVDSACP